jgi:hypothetical protein
MRKDIKITHLGTELEDPYILSIRLVSRSRGDIPSSAFDQGRPIILDAGKPIIALLPTDENKARLPKIESDHTKLKIGPDLIAKRQETILAILVDGEVAQLAGEAYLTDGRLLQMPSAQQFRFRANTITASIAAVAAGLFAAGSLTYGALSDLFSILFLIFFALVLISGASMQDFLKWRYK